MAVFAQDQSEAVIRRQPHGPKAVPFVPSELTAISVDQVSSFITRWTSCTTRGFWPTPPPSTISPGIEHADAGGDEAADILRVAIDPGQRRGRAGLGPGEELLRRGGRADLRSRANPWRSAR